MKKRLLVDAGLLLLIPISIVGFSMSIDNQDKVSVRTSTDAKSNHIATTADKEYVAASTNDALEIKPMDFSPNRVYRVRYSKVNFRTSLDDDYREERLYRYVPGAKKHNRSYAWSKLKAKVGKRVYVDMKAKAYYRDDDGESETEDFYRIRSSASNKATKYWVNEDAVDVDD
ncbi:hypothetical protein YK48G_04880 [Lentilactobacillus fungorum]|uniref:Surface layer protein A domain-containing protein n=1 Tax=Lentilactobacillus fungorum TaxID=2201250 RepID=A0ABQ3VWL4_9LACO|nr:hypothetical protein [Lentilactobacillus fungorum]GHP13063.1 hypothetical protein YK48G_04880 [Lentilactobacillus fungorum]